MKNNIIKSIIIICLLTGTITSAQNSSCRINFVNPKSFLVEMDSLRINNQYDSIISIVNNRMNIGATTIWHYYQLACMYSLKGDTIKPFYYLYKSIKMGASSEDILSDTDFEKLKGTNQWLSMLDTLIYRYLEQYPNITNKELSVKLWLMGIEDQKTRSLGDNNKLKYSSRGTKEWDKLIAKLNKQYRNETKKRTVFIMNLVKDGKWPLYSTVGQKAADAASFIVQHSNNKRIMRKTIPLLKRAVDLKEASGEDYALILDRYLMHNKKKQIYGTQVIKYDTKKRNGKGEQIMSEWEFWPIENEKDLNNRRLAIGLPPIEKYAEMLGVKYIYKYAN